MTKKELIEKLKEAEGNGNAFERLELKVAALAEFLLEHKVTPR
jgi:hypothetical protein